MKPILSLIAFVSLGLSVSAQQPVGGCEDEIKYENWNQVDYGPLSMQTITGIAEDKDQAVIPKVCLGLFTEKGHRLITSAATDEEGYFRLNTVPPGRYRLIAKYPGFTPANVPIKITRRPSKEEMQGKHFVILMKPGEIDTCSYGTYQ